MTTETIRSICETRMLIGFLGEKKQASWWGSSFLSSSSKAFLLPICPNSFAVAQYSGVCQAAALIHDEHIGIGQHYHLYRLPDSIERSLFKCMQDHAFSEKLSSHLLTIDVAMNRLKDLGMEPIDRADGPIVVGDYSDKKLDALFRVSRSHYLDAFITDYKTFPYMRCS